MPKWYDPMAERRNDFNDRLPMDRRVIRYIIRCKVCETLNDITHGQAHAAPNFEIPCTTCETLLPKNEVRHATQGRENPLDPR